MKRWVTNHLRRRWRLLAVVATLVAVATGLALLLLPVRIARRVLPELVARLGLVDADLGVRRFDAFGVDLGPIRLGSRRAPALTIDAVRAEYSPSGLRARRLDRIVVNGLRLRAEFVDGKLAIPGLNLKRWSNPPVPSGEADPASAWRVASCELRNATLALRHGGRDYLLPFEGEAIAGSGDGEYLIVLKVFPRGEMVEFSGMVRNASPGVVEVNIPRLELGRFAELAWRLGGIRLQGDLAMTGAYCPGSGDFRVKARVTGLELERGSVRVSNARLPDGSSAPLELRAKGGREEMHFRVDRLRVESPLVLELAMPEDGVLRYGPDGIGFTLQPRLTLAAEEVQRWTGLSPEPGLDLGFSLTLTGSRDAPGNWELGGQLSARTANWRLDGAAGAWRWRWRPLQFRGRGQGLTGAGRIGVKATQLSWVSPAVGVAIPTMELFGDVELGHDGLAASGFAKFANGHGQAGEFRAAGVTATLPWRWPAPAAPVRVVGARRSDLGSVTATRLLWGQVGLGSLTAELYQDRLGYLWVARQEGWLPPLALSASGLAELRPGQGPVFEAEFSLDEPPATGIEVALGGLAPWFGTATLKGKPSCSGQLAWDQVGGLQASAKVGLSEGLLAWPEQRLQVAGLGVKMAFTDLRQLRTEPRQRLRFTAVQAGGLEFGKGKVDFQLEANHRLFVEQAEARWCGGKVSCPAWRYQPGQRKELALTLLCDRLRLTEVLRQLKVAEAEGEGTVSGQIPLVMVGNLIDLTDGFLYSRPGQGGVLHLADAGMFAGAESGLQVAILREAMRNYVYDWVTIQLNRDGQDLLTRLEFSGRPAQPLPFGVDAAGGLFKAAADGPWRANFQDLRLEFNFRLPLEHILEYGSDWSNAIGGAAATKSTGSTK